MNERLSRTFYARPTLLVARDLLGKRLVRLDEGRRIAGTIVETEAYIGEEDLGCHCRAGLTRRTAMMYGPPGHAYVYFTYGMHWMLNFVTEPQGKPAAVLIRAIRAEEGVETIAARRKPQKAEVWTDGPAKLCQALGIDRRFNSVDLCQAEGELWVEEGRPIAEEGVTIGPRVGLTSVPEPWKSMPWRFLVKELQSGKQG